MFSKVSDSFKLLPLLCSSTVTQYSLFTCLCPCQVFLEEEPRSGSHVVGGGDSVQHPAGDRRAGSSERREPQPAGEPAGGDGEPAGGGQWQRWAGEERHHPPITGEDRAGAERGAGPSRAETKPSVSFMICVVGWIRTKCKLVCACQDPVGIDESDGNAT